MIIPTRDRLPILLKTLAALAQQRLDGVRAEVVVVDNGSGDGTLAALEALQRAFPIPLQPLAEPASGAGPARNAGLRAARGDVVLFLGDDTRPAQPDLLRRHAGLHAAQSGSVPYAVLGRVAWAPELSVTPLMRWLERGPQFAYADMVAGPARPEHFYTAHLSIRRDLVRDAGGFDTRVPIYFEDSLLGRRLFAGGLRLEYHPNLLVHHDHPVTLASWVRRQEQVGRSGRRVRQIAEVEDKIVPRPGGWRWTAATMLARIAGTPESEWRNWPASVRDRLYAAAHYAAYARGYGHRAP